MSRAVRRLTKRDVEALLERYDDDPIGALSTALRRLLSDESGADRPGSNRAAGAQPDGGAGDEWTDLVQAAGFDPARTAALAARDQATLDALAAELNELRTLQRSPDRAPRGAIDR